MAQARFSIWIVSVLVALGVAVLVLATGLVVWMPQAKSPPEPINKGQRDQAAAFDMTATAPNSAPEPPAWRKNSLGQPLAADGEPLDVEDKLRAAARQPPAPHDIALTPPRIYDRSERQRFKRWWVDEMVRRVDVFQRLEPRRAYPAAGETSALLQNLYDAAEPRGRDESVELAYERRRQWRTLWQAFTDLYGATPKTVAGRGGDPQYGRGEAPPTLGFSRPPPDPSQDGTPVELAEDAPPGRSSEDRAGGEPIPAQVEREDP